MKKTMVIIILMCVSVAFTAGSKSTKQSDPNQIKNVDPNQKVVKLEKVALNQQLKTAGVTVQLTDAQIAKLNANPRAAARFQREIARSNKQMQKSQRRLDSKIAQFTK